MAVPGSSHGATGGDPRAHADTCQSEALSIMASFNFSGVPKPQYPNQEWITPFPLNPQIAMGYGETHYGPKEGNSSQNAQQGHGSQAGQQPVQTDIEYQRRENQGANPER